MSDLNAKIIAKASGTAGEVPSGSELDVAELAVNTADGKLFTKHTDNTVKQLGGGVENASIGDLSDVNTAGATQSHVLQYRNNAWRSTKLDDALAEPGPAGEGTRLQSIGDVDVTGLVDGDILAWNAQAGSWGRTPNAAAAVSSVNGQVGDVGLGVSELEDTSVGAFIIPSGAQFAVISGNTDNEGEGEWTSTAVSFNRNRSQDAIDDTDYSYLAGRELRIYETLANGVPVDGGTVWTVTIDSVNTSYTGATAYCRLNYANQGVAPTVTHFRISDGIVPSNGQVLTWQSSTETWVAASGGGGGGGAVDSVNDQIGNVSLGIQDMNDFALNPIGVSYTFTPRGTSGDFSQAERWFTGISGSIGNYFTFSKSSVNRDELFALSIGDSVTFTFDGGTPFQATVTVGGTGFGFNTDYISISQTWPAEAATATTVVVSSPTFAGVTYEPLANGDTLAWNESEQKFKPAQGGAGGVSSVNGKQGAVELDLEDLNNVAPGYDGTRLYNDKNVQTNLSGRWNPAAAGDVRFYATDSNNEPLPANFADVTGLQLRGTNGVWVSTQSHTLTGDVNSGTVQAVLTQDDYVLANLTGSSSMEVRWDDLASTPTDAQRLAYSADNQAWVPVDYVAPLERFEVSTNAASGFTVTGADDRTFIVATYSGAITVTFNQANVFEGAQVQVLNLTGSDVTITGSVSTALSHVTIPSGGAITATYANSIWHAEGDLYTPGASFSYTLDGATDFSPATPHSDGQLIVHDGTNYVNEGVSDVLARGSIADLGDVTLTDNQDNQYLVYDSTSQSWASEVLDTSSIVSEVQLNTNLDELANVNSTGKADGDTLVWSAAGNAWIPGSGSSGGGDDKVDKLMGIRVVVGDYTVQAADSAEMLEVNSGSIITLPSNLDVGFQVVVFANTASPVILSAPGGLRTSNLATQLSGQYSAATAVHKGGGEWYAFGDLS